MALIKNYKFVIIILAIFFISCKEKKVKSLPYLGHHTIENNDTTYFQLPEFEFVKQSGDNFGSKNLKGKPYVAYFFFTSCPSICPRMTQGALRVQRSLKKYKQDFNIMAFSIDPDRDSLPKLRSYAKKYDVDLDNYHFIRGKEEVIYEVGKKGFYLGMSKDKNEPGGYLHSEKMVLVDKDAQLRGYYAGTDAGEVKNLINDLKLLIKENSN